MSARVEKRVPPGSLPHERHSAGAGADAPSRRRDETAMPVKSARAPRKDASLMVGILDDLLDRNQPRLPEALREPVRLTDGLRLHDPIIELNARVATDHSY